MAHLTLTPFQTKIVAEIQQSLQGDMHIVRMPRTTGRRTAMASACARWLSEAKTDTAVILFAATPCDNVGTRDLICEHLSARPNVSVEIDKRGNGTRPYTLLKASVKSSGIAVHITHPSNMRGLGSMPSLAIIDDRHPSYEYDKTQQMTDMYMAYMPYLAQASRLWVFTHDVKTIAIRLGFLVARCTIHRYFYICDACCAKGNLGVTICGHADQISH